MEILEKRVNWIKMEVLDKMEILDKKQKVLTKVGILDKKQKVLTKVGIQIIQILYQCPNFLSNFLTRKRDFS